jgi:hypothetical protein
VVALHEIPGSLLCGPSPGFLLFAMLTKTESELIRRVRETLESLWDCSTPLVCGYGETECERCSTLNDLDRLLQRAKR